MAYNPPRKRNMFKDKEPYRLSRSRIENYLRCPRCFYIDRKLGVDHPPGFPFSLNMAVDSLLKKEFDHYREKGIPHILMEEEGIKAVPMKHPKLQDWRNSLHKGVEYDLPGTKIVVCGGIDDVWKSERDELLVVDYKATAKKGDVSIDADWQIGYRRQMDFYQWLLRKTGHEVSSTGYFVYCNANLHRDCFDGKLEFFVKILKYEGDDSWVEKTVLEAIECLKGNKAPAKKDSCDWCKYYSARELIESSMLKDS